MKVKQKPGVVFQPQVQRALQRGIHTIVSAVRPTLGPLSGGVAIDRMYSTKLLPEFVDESGVIARRIIELPNRDEDMGAMLARTMIARQHERVGDGTAMAAVLLEAIFNGGLRYIAAGGNAAQLRRHLDNALPVILDELERQVSPLADESALTRMAYSLCQDETLAGMLGEAFDLVGADGRLEIREDYGRVLRREYVEGTYYHTGLFSRALLPEGSDKITLENPAIFLCDFEIADHHTLFPVLQTAHAAGIRQLVIVTRSLSDQAVSLLVTNNRLDKIKAVAVRLPGLNPTDRMTALEDLSRLTGAQPFVALSGETLEGVTAAHFGRARRVWADKKAFGIVGGGGDPVALRRHLRDLKTVALNATEAATRQRAQERLAELMGNSVTLWVGGFTETEINARKRQAQRAALTLRAALADGVLPGGGIALLNCRDALEQCRLASADPAERAAYRILIDALAAPARIIFRNAGHDPSEVMALLAYESPEIGFDVLANRLVNVCAAGILDSALVLKTSVRNAVTTAALALTIDSLVHLSQAEIVRKPQ